MPADGDTYYTDPATGILRNNVGARTWEELDAAMAASATAAIPSLAFDPPEMTYDLSQLCEIHRRLFSPVFPWAGQPRTVEISKPGDTTFFMLSSFLQRGGQYVLEWIHGHGELKGLDHDEFVQALAQLYDIVNYLHPFREGNGRTNRVFLMQIGSAAGWNLDWTKIPDAETNNMMSKIAMDTGDVSGLANMLSPTVSRRVPNHSVDWSSAVHHLRREDRGSRAS